MKYLSQFDLLQIRTRLQTTTGQTFDLLNPHALHTALAAPRQVVFGEEIYPGLAAKAAILFSRLIQNHPFYDGNKRIALEALRLFLERNGRRLVTTDTDARQMARQLVEDNAPLPILEAWIEQHLDAD